MAIFHANTSCLSRRDGRSAVAAAAYRSASALYDEREGRAHDYERKRGVVLAEVVSPDGSELDRATLWNAAEASERRKDARTAREWVLALPHELGAEGRAELVRAFAAELAQRYGVAVDFAIHAPHREGDQRNHHAHVLTTTRAVARDAEGRLVLGGKTAIELSDRDRRKAGLGSGAQEIETLRALWAGLANRALERAGVAERIDHRSFEAQGIERAATVHLGPVASLMERRGRRSDRGDQNRAVRAANAERAELGAEVIELAAERARREQLAQEQAERIRLEREQAEKAAAAARAAELAAEQQRAARERQAAEKLAQEQAKRARAAQERRERFLRLSSAELAAEIRAATPAPPEVLAAQRPAVVAAREEAERLGKEIYQAHRQAEAAFEEAWSFRREHPWVTWLHDNVVGQKPLVEMSEREAAARARAEFLHPLARTAEESHRALREYETARIAEEQRPQREIRDRLWKVVAQRREKEREQERVQERFEQAQQQFEDLAIRREAGGLDDDDSRWRRLPKPLREFIDRYIATPEAERQVLVQELHAPALQQALSMGRSLSMGRGMSR